MYKRAVARKNRDATRKDRKKRAIMVEGALEATSQQQPIV